MDRHKDTKRVRWGLREAFKILRRRQSQLSLLPELRLESDYGNPYRPEDETSKIVFYHGQDSDDALQQGAGDRDHDA
jgi:hypothetical protein